ETEDVTDLARMPEMRRAVAFDTERLDPPGKRGQGRAIGVQHQGSEAVSIEMPSQRHELDLGAPEAAGIGVQRNRLHHGRRTAAAATAAGRAAAWPARMPEMSQ